MPQQELETPVWVPPLEQEPGLPRFGGGGGGGGGDRRRGSDFTPKEVSQIFELLQKASDKYFRENSQQPIPEQAVHELNHVLFGEIGRSTEDKDGLLRVLAAMEAQAETERGEREGALTSEQMVEAIKRTSKKIRDCFFPRLRRR